MTPKDKGDAMWVPLAGWLIVAPVTTEESFAGSQLLIPGTARARITRWQYDVLASGGPAPLEKKERATPSDILPGQWILAPQRVAFDVPEEEVTLLAERHVWAIVA